ncbi:efflux RND transporter periplasmic adaptor subunit [Prosthecomicrobium pneumaticum]|uniref:RND family efflux transporter MFP subunit n=1 Tax=Prosthecomicrobium pneumaticum TaxID=81895 RepID=A0A7W9L214_9HYPH|nr:efflux RND transporter periplasmic adaptor subunit [Prosthecomicrobium pneumaticum]MBB5753111.1 RND family efflux transporter MFP subunit [Prosthecomicrobium pneumaticum]
MSRPIRLAFLLCAFGGLAAPAAAADFLVEARPVTEFKAVFGRVESRTVVPARARIGGTIRSISVTEGREVTEGETIAEVVDDKLALQRDAAEAQLKQLQSQRDNARTDLARAEQLVARGISPQSQLDQARTQYEVAVNQVTAAEANRAVIVQQASEGAIVAPATGRVLTVPVTLGSVVLAGEEIARIASGRYFLRLSLPERHAAEIEEGDVVRIGARGLSPESGPQTTREGRVAKVYPEITDGLVVADVEVDGIGDYFVNERTLVWIPVGERTALAVPAEAVTLRHGVDYVRLTAADGPLDIAVITGETRVENGRTMVEILTGLHDGDRVVLPGEAK